MIQRDYILRMIADLAEFLAKLLKLSKDNLPEAFDEAAAKIEELYGISFSDFLALNDLSLIKADWPFNSGIADKLGEYLMEMAKMADDLGRSEVRQNLLHKALSLFEQAEDKTKSYSFERMVAVTKIKEMLGV